MIALAMCICIPFSFETHNTRASVSSSESAKTCTKILPRAARQAPEVMHQLHRVLVVDGDVIGVDRWNAEACSRQQVASIPHLHT